MLCFPWNGTLVLLHIFFNIFSIMWNHVSSSCHFYSSPQLSYWSHNHIHTLRKCIYFICFMWLGTLHINWSKPPLLCCTWFQVSTEKCIGIALLLWICIWGLFLVDSRPCCLMCRCTSVVFIDVSIWLLIKKCYEARIYFGENHLDWLDKACCCRAKEWSMKILRQLWYGCLGHNIIYHHFWLLCLQGNLPHSCLFVPGTFYYLLSIFLL